MMGYSEHCPCKPRAPVEDVAPKMGPRGRQPKTGSLTLLLPPNWLSAELSLSLGNKRKGGTMVGHRAVPEGSRSGQTHQFSHLKEGNDTNPAPQIFFSCLYFSEIIVIIIKIFT